ncbi:uncharacterized protein KY384_006054 [Bacidia gigantensis]|uniref:uncharacterized protein n=1 Tax=Bacidia gigantensis TaxID=2732470 RepID=UPI001D0512BA|nr:uncharacterized protein KY384_006054 [Bacidia gigantensis]KAG8529417.1 hypothetical protein KY384_006054 [Bacidia gigantensis]
MTNFAIAITSDSVCPWCYVGKKKLEQGIALYQSKYPNSTDTFTTTWLPYQLNPQSPSSGVDKRQYLSTIYGPERIPAVEVRLAQIGQSVGIPFKFGGKTGNTRDSHRLIHMAKEKAGTNVQNRVVDELNRSYFENEGDITDPNVLTHAAIKAGLDEMDVQQWLQTGAGGREVDDEVAEARRRGITGVPHFVLQDKYEISGAREPEAFLGAFERIREMESK